MKIQIDKTDWHWMQPLTGKKIPKRFLFLSNVGKKILWQSYTYDKSEWTKWNEGTGLTNILVEAIESKPWYGSGIKPNNLIWIIGKNIENILDEQGFFDQLDAGTVVIKRKGNVLSYFTGDITIIKFAVSNVNCIAIDIANWGFENDNFTEEYKEFAFPEIQAAMDFVTMVDKEDMGSLATTTASQGKIRYRTHDMPKKIILHGLNKEVRALERRSWGAARCEVKRLGLIDEKVYNLDVKSMYTSIVSRKMMPTKAIDYYEEMSIDQAKEVLDSGKQIIADVRLQTNEPIYPKKILNPGIGDREITVWGVGSFDTTLCFPEFVTAIKNEHIVKINKAVSYEQDFIFNENSEWYLRQREAIKTKPYFRCAPQFKQCTNGMYSNLGKKSKQWICLEKEVSDFLVKRHTRNGKWSSEMLTPGIPTFYRAVQGIAQYYTEANENQYSMPSISATIWSWGRRWMWDLYVAAGIDNVIYCDTDCPMVNEQGKKNLEHYTDPDGKTPGMLSLKNQSEDAVLFPKNAKIFAPKWYRIGDYVVMAGEPNKKNWDENKVIDIENFHYGSVDNNGKVSPIIFLEA